MKSFSKSGESVAGIFVGKKFGKKFGFIALTIVLAATASIRPALAARRHRAAPAAASSSEEESAASASKPSEPSVLVTHTAHDPALEKALGDAGCPVAHHTDNNYMWRVLAPDKLARRFAMAPEAAAAHAFELFADSRSVFWTADRF